MQNLTPPSCEHSPWAAGGEAEAAATAGVSSRIETAAATLVGVRNRTLLGRNEKLVHPAEELIQHHAGDASQQTLPHARDETTDLDVAVARDARPAGGIRQLDHGISTHEARRPGSLYRHAVAVGRLLIGEPHLALERALHRS